MYDSIKPKTIFNEKIVAIDYSGEEVVLMSKGGIKYRAKMVISSLPLGVLKKEVVKFTPPLPAAYNKAIDNMTSGVMNKVYLKFKEDFWSHKGSWTLLYTEDELKYNVVVNEA